MPMGNPLEKEKLGWRGTDSLLIYNLESGAGLRGGSCALGTQPEAGAQTVSPTEAGGDSTHRPRGPRQRESAVQTWALCSWSEQEAGRQVTCC